MQLSASDRRFLLDLVRRQLGDDPPVDHAGSPATASAPAMEFLLPRSLEPMRGMDPGIQRAVDILRGHGVETYESCEGGPGHPFTEPTVRFHGSRAAGFHAVSVCIDYGLPVMDLRRVWHVHDGHDLTGPTWEIVFREKLA